MTTDQTQPPVPPQAPNWDMWQNLGTTNPRQPPNRPSNHFRNLRRFLLIGATAILVGWGLLVIAASLAGPASTSSPTPITPPHSYGNDVSISSCALTPPYANPHAVLLIHNSSRYTLTYDVNVAFSQVPSSQPNEVPTRFAEGWNRRQYLAPGETATLNVAGNPQVSPDSTQPIKCRITHVEAVPQ